MIFGITDKNLYTDEAVYFDKIDSFLASKNIDFLILRDKALNIIEYDAFLKKVLTRNLDYKHKIIVHNHAPLAFKYGIDRVHMPERYITNEAFQAEIERIKAVTPIQVMYSYHPKYEVDALTEDTLSKADYIIVSPALPTTHRPDAKPIDRELLSTVRNKYSDRLILLGGMNIETIKIFAEDGYQHFAIRSGLEEIAVR